EPSFLLRFARIPPHPSFASQMPPVSLRLGPAAALTVRRTVIHYRGARFARLKGKAFAACGE
ncbi:MAG: hypothetical protein IKC04_05930, partial [Oscillospiraceae bacterium]|nr:hypothetical protein [Oscillospiraceae bacterium]